MTETERLFRLAVDEFGRRVAAVPEDRWAAPTPCAEWDVRALVNHLVYELRWAPDLLAGRTVEDVGDAYEGELLGADPVASWEAAADGARAAVAADGALDATVHLSYGDSAADDYVRQLTGDLTVHAWDLARGAGLDDRLDPRLVRATADAVEPRQDMLAASGLFAPPVDVGPDADDQTRLLGMFGRRA